MQPVVQPVLQSAVSCRQPVIQLPAGRNVLHIHSMKHATSSTVRTAALPWHNDVINVLPAPLKCRLAGLISIVHLQPAVQRVVKYKHPVTILYGSSSEPADGPSWESVRARPGRWRSWCSSCSGPRCSATPARSRSWTARRCRPVSALVRSACKSTRCYSGPTELNWTHQSSRVLNTCIPVFTLKVGELNWTAQVT